LWVPELRFGQPHRRAGTRLVSAPTSLFGVSQQEEARVQVGDPITEEAVSDVAKLLAIAYERYSAALPARLEIAAARNTDLVDKSDTSSRHGQ